MVTGQPSTRIIDIRHNAAFVPLADQIRSGLAQPEGQEKRLPTLLLYDRAGLQLFEKITYLDEYYLTNEEIQLLEKHADEIADRIQPHSVVLELGSGNLRKVRLLLQALDRKQVPVTYYALDLSYEELERTLDQVPQVELKYVQCKGLWGTYDDGLLWLAKPENKSKPKTVLWLGSSIGNLKRDEAVDFLRQFTAILGTQDSFLLAVDGCTNADRVYHAYNDSQGVTHEFILNGLTQANKMLGKTAFDLDAWEVIGEYEPTAGRHHAFVSPKRNVLVEGIKIKAGERVRIEESYKYDSEQMRELVDASGLVDSARWMSEAGTYGLHLLRNAGLSFPTVPVQYAGNKYPNLAEWNDLWSAWDTVTRKMIPEKELLEKPIKLRNACIFYLGHIPTFLDIHLTRSTKGGPTEPSYYTQIFERGIDPDVDDPEKCHAHSEIPDSWPELPQILAFQGRVRERVQGLYASNQVVHDERVQKALWLGYEHEAMHLETLLYMLVQSEKTLPPPNVARPDFEAQARKDASAAITNEWFKIPEQTVTIGMDGDVHYFGWDNESPSRSVNVTAFAAKARPITVGEYALYLERTGKSSLPASWDTHISEPVTTASKSNGITNGHGNGGSDGRSNGNSNGHSIRHGNGHSNGHGNGHSNGHDNGHSNGHSDSHKNDAIAEPSKAFLEGKFVRTVYGKFPLAYALHWPVSASYDELAVCASYMGGRIPTFEETRSIYHHAEMLKQMAADQSRSEMIPAVNGHLSNDGVEETPPAKQADGAHPAGGSSHLRDLFIDLTDTNTAFHNWHPVAVTDKGDRLAGQSGMGGLWEWTSTTLAPHEGFQAMELYPGYTSDFFDSKHNIVLGGSWSTLPRIAGRKSFVNWYQRNYPYVWAGARLVRDIE